VIEALFGSKTRVKLLHLFLNNPNKSFYVREITRTIEEQINSVRRELANMLNIGLISSEESDNKLYYRAEKKYKYFNELRSIFDDNFAYNSSHQADTMSSHKTTNPKLNIDHLSKITKLNSLKLVILSGNFVENTNSNIDILIVGNPTKSRLESTIIEIEKLEKREIIYTLMHYDEFYYRLSIRDKFITDIVDGDREILIDKENLFK